MIIECPKCQTTLTIAFEHIEAGSEIACVDCQVRLRMRVVPEMIFTNGSSRSFQKNDEDTGNQYPEMSFSSHHRNGRETVLMCIDGEATREIVSTLLQESDYQVLDIPSGVSAFMKMKLNPPALALIDTGLTDTPYSELCAQIKETPGLSKTIVLLVGSMFETNTKYAHETPDLLGADDYIARRSIQKDLLAKIAQYLETKEECEKDIVEEVSSEKQGVLDLSPRREDSFPRIDEPLNQAMPTFSEAVSNEKPSPQEVKRAKKFAEIIVSDIVMFNDRKVEEGLRNGNFFEVLEEEIKEGREVYETKVSESFWSSGYYEEALKSFVGKNTHKTIQKAEEEEILSSEKPTEVLKRDEILADEPSQARPEPALANEPESPEIKGARRLAKIIVSDIVIYNQSKVEEGLEKGTFYELLENEIIEGRQLFESRVDESLYYSGVYEQALEAFVQRETRSKGQQMPKTQQVLAPQAEISSRTSEPEKVAEALETKADQVFVPIEAVEDEEEADFDSDIILDKSPEFLDRAKQLANSIIEEVAAKNELKIEEALREGTFYERLGDEMMEGRQLFELKAPAYFDSSVYEEAIEHFIASRNVPELSEVDSEMDKPTEVFEKIQTRAEFPVEGDVASELEDIAWESPIAPEPENPNDIFGEMEREAEAFAQEDIASELEDSAWQSPVIPEPFVSNTGFEEMEEQGEAFSPEDIHPELEDSAWKSPVLPEPFATNTIFGEMDQQAEALVAEASVPQPVTSFPATVVSEEESEEIKNAKRLAKIIVSDIVIYNEKKVQKGLKDGHFYEILQEEIGEGRRLFESRVSQPLLVLNLYEGAIESFIQSRTGAAKISAGEAIPDSEQATQVYEKPPDINNVSGKSAEMKEGVFHPSNGHGVPDESKEEKDARRLAKIIVSDIVIYNEKKVEAGLQKGNFYEVLAHEIKEGTLLYESRVSQGLLGKTDYLKEAFEDFIAKKTTSLS